MNFGNAPMLLSPCNVAHTSTKRLPMTPKYPVDEDVLIKVAVGLNGFVHSTMLCLFAKEMLRDCVLVSTAPTPQAGGE